MQPRRLRAVRIADTEVTIDHRADGTTYVRSSGDLGAYPTTLTERLDHWAEAAPDRTFLAERTAEGEWHHLSYSAARRDARAVAQALLHRELSVERPIAILSGNSLDH